MNLDNDALNKVSSLLLHEFNLGLGRETNETATVKMFPTFVRDVPNGKGKGFFLRFLNGFFFLNFIENLFSNIVVYFRYKLTYI